MHSKVVSDQVATSMVQFRAAGAVVSGAVLETLAVRLANKSMTGETKRTMLSYAKVCFASNGEPKPRPCTVNRVEDRTDAVAGLMEEIVGNRQVEK